MPHVPAFCDSCSTVFNSGIYAENSSISFSGNKSGPCPSCGGMGHIPDGVFNFIGNTIEILSAPERTISELTRFAQILHQAKEKEETREQVLTRVERELPSLSKLVKLLPENKSELYGFLALVLAALQLFSQPPSTQTSTTINVTQIIQQVITEPVQLAKPSKKIGRNEPCICGSGVKYKKCCGKLK